MDEKLFQELCESIAGVPFIGPCDRIRRTEAGEQFWHNMMRNRQGISEEKFLANVDVSSLLYEGETWEEYRDTAKAEDPSFGLYKSGSNYFIQVAGFEMIFGPKRLREELNKE